VPTAVESAAPVKPTASVKSTAAPVESATAAEPAAPATKSTAMKPAAAAKSASATKPGATAEPTVKSASSKPIPAEPAAEAAVKTAPTEPETVAVAESKVITVPEPETIAIEEERVAESEAAEPRSGSDEESVSEPFRTVVAVRRTLVRVISVVTVSADRRPIVPANHNLRMRRGSRRKKEENAKQSQIL
jgi:hypothetical protein